MKSASISKLKATLSACLAWVKAGEEVVITERGKPIAKIVPLSQNALDQQSHLIQLERAGLAQLGTGVIPDDFWRLPRPKDSEGAGLQALLEERDTGR